MNEVTQTNTNTAPTLDDIESSYFGPAELDKAQAAIDAVITICNANDADVKYNFDPESEFPDGYGIAIFPVTKRGANGNETIGACIGAVPSPELIAESEGGADYIQSAILSNVVAKLRNAVRPRSTGTAAASVPFTVTDFITSSRGGETLATFKKLSGLFVKALKKKGVTFMTNQLLRQTLQSSAFAEEQFPKFPQTAWTGVLNAMIVKAKAEKLDPSILENWLETRDNVELTVQDIDLSNFALDDIDDNDE